jgi:hypothetical protein
MNQLARRMMTSGLVLLPLLLGACGPAARRTSGMRGAFDYDARPAPAVRIAGTETRDGVSIHDVEYAGLDGEPVRAYLVIPRTAGRAPGLVYTHPAPGSRTTYLDEAVEMGRRGVASLVLDAPWSREAFWLPLFKDGAADLQRYTGVVVGLRRAVDVLAARPEVDAARIGYVGHSFGAAFGGALVGAEPRIRAAVLIAGPSSFTEIAAVNNPELTGEARDRYAREMAPIDPVNHVGRAAGRPVLFQFPRQEQYFAEATFLRYAAAAGDPKEVRWYDGDHYLKSSAARDERIAWLLQRLGGR